MTKTIRKEVHGLFCLLFCTILISQNIYAQSKSQPPVHIKYISKEAVYIDAGKNSGLAKGDTLTIHRGRQLIGFAVVVHLSRKSAACRLIRSKVKIRVGDSVRLPRAARTKSQTATANAKRSRGRTKNRAEQKKSRQKAANSPNQVRGYFSIQSYWQRANANAAFVYSQPSFSGKLRVKNLAGTGLAFKLRQRSRLYRRSHSSYYQNRENEWIHRFFEMCLSYESPDSPFEFGLGRVYSPHIRGIGYIDGVHVSTKMTPNIQIGFAAGKEPDEETSTFRSVRNKYGAFVALETGSYQKQRLATTVAVSASYEKGMVNREFVYLQNNYWLADRLSIYQSVEIDLNRDWRKAAAGKSYSFSNFYFTANAFLSPALSAYFSFDARKNIRVLNTMNTPDSVFDDATREGVSGGMRLTLPSNMRLGANVSLRFQEGGLQNTIFSSIYYSIRQFPARGHSVTARLSYIDTQFTTGYRPSINYRLPFSRNLTFNVIGGGYIYKNATLTTKSYYPELQAYYTFLRRYFLSVQFRQYLDAKLESSRFFVEAGVNF